MALKQNYSPCHQGFTMPQATVKDLKHLHDVLEKVLPDLANVQPPNTPVFQDSSQRGPNIAQLEQSLVKLIHDGCSSIRPPVESTSAQPYSASNEQEENVQVADETGLSSPISTTPDDFKSFEKWASGPQFETAVESCEPPTRDNIHQETAPGACSLEYKRVLERWNDKLCKYEIVESESTEGCNDDAPGVYVFVIRERVDRKTEQMTRFIDVKSKQLCGVLRNVLRDVSAVSMIEDKPSVEENVLFHFLPELKQSEAEMKTQPDCDSQCLDHLNLLVRWVIEAYASVSQRLSSLLNQNLITYDLLWALFKPGCHVYTNCLGTEKPRCVVFDAGEEVTREGVTYYKLESRYLDHDGKMFGEAGVILGVLKFRGSKPIETLDAFPLRFHPNHDQIHQELVETGRKFCSLAGTHTQRCDGSAFIMKDGEPIKMNVNSCVTVDAAFFNVMQPNYSRPRVHDKWAQKSDSITIFSIDTLFDDDRTRNMEKLKSSSMELHRMSEEDLLICSPTVRGFSFKEKMFMEFAVADLHDVQWSPESFKCLKIPQNAKKLLLSLAKTRLGRTPIIPFDDFVEGKGRGLSILLHGPPGVGKTSTVEAAAEWFNLPLYSISAGELDVDHGDPNALDQQLKRIFKIAKHFDAVLLLDEADAFMERRIASHGAHNRLVTVFLRNLEYYEGILFLTTNRAPDFDDAVLSRIHLKIKYDDLTKDARRGIWSYFLSKANTHQGPVTVSSVGLRHLESMALNGRDIKNLTSIAHALASDDGHQVDFSYLQMAAEANEKFLKEFSQHRHIEGIYI